MKDLIITVKQQKRELICILVCLALATGVNVYAIITYATQWKELYTQWFKVLALTGFFYILTAIFRLIFWLIKNRKSKIEN